MAKGPTQRLFVALIPPEEIAQRLAALAPEKSRPEKLIHLTARFIGEVKTSLALAFADSLAAIKVKSFDLTVKGLGLFAPGTFWAGVSPAPGLLTLIEAVDLKAQEVFGLRPNQLPLTPHMTIARLRRNPDVKPLTISPELAKMDFGSFRVQSFSLWESILDPKGARRVLIQEYPLI